MSDRADWGYEDDELSDDQDGVGGPSPYVTPARWTRFTNEHPNVHRRDVYRVPSRRP